MRSRKQFGPLAVAAIVGLGLATTAHADNLTWIAGDGSGGDGDWNTVDAHWSGTASTWDNTRGDTAIFDQAGGTVTLTQPITASQLSFLASGYTVTGNTLTLSGLKRIEVADTQSATLSTSLAGSSGVDFAVSGGTGTGQILLTGNNSGLTGPVTLSNMVVAVDGSQVNNRLSNNASVTLNDASTFEIRGVNALPTAANSVDFTVNAGSKLRVVTGDSAFATTSHAHVRNLTLNGGTIELGYAGSGAAYDGESFQLNGDVTVGGSAPSSVVVTDAAAGNQQGISLLSTRTFTINDATGDAAPDLTVAGEIEGNGKLIKAGGGTMAINAAASLSGGYDVNAGVLQLGVGGSTGAIRGTVNVAGGATLRLSAGNSLGYGSGAKVNILNVAEGGLVDNVAGGDNGWGLTLNLTGGTVRSNGGTSANNTAQLFALGGGSSVNTFASATSSEIAGRINLREGNAGDTLTFTIEDGAAADDLIVSAAITQGGTPRSIAKAGPGQMVISGNGSNFTGTISVLEGTLVFGRTNTTQTGGAARPVIIEAGGTLSTNNSTNHNHLGAVTLNGGTLSVGPGTASYNSENYQLNGDVTVGGTVPSLITRDAGRTNANSGIGLSGDRTFTVADVTASPASDLIVSQELEDNDSAGDGLIKSGPGTMELQLANSYTGATAVTAGTLLVNGSIGGSGVTVSGGTLGGTGSVTAPITVDLGGSIAPGASIGTLTSTKAVTFAAGGAGGAPTLSSELGAPGVSDLLNLTSAGADGLLTLAADDRLDLLPLQNITSESIYTIVSTAGSVDGVFDAVLVNGELSQSVNPTGSNYVLVSYPAAGQPGDIVVTVNNLTAVPEPASLGLLAMAGIGLLRRRSRSLR